MESRNDCARTRHVPVRVGACELARPESLQSQRSARVEKTSRAGGNGHPGGGALDRRGITTRRGEPQPRPGENGRDSEEPPLRRRLRHSDHQWIDTVLYFCHYRSMPSTASKKNTEQVTKYADMFSAMGTEARLRIMQLLLSAHPEGLVVGEIQEELDIPNSTLSHHLDKLRNEGLVNVRRESTFLRYTANTDALQELLQFLYAECCTRNKALKPQDIVQICR